MLSSTIKVVTMAAAIVATTGLSAMAGSGPDDGGKAFTACMRSHGLPDFPDVTVSSNGLINLSIEGERVDVMSEKYGAALKACESLLPKGTRFPSAPEPPPPAPALGGSLTIEPPPAPKIG